MQKRFFILYALFTLCVIVASALLVGHYVHLNYDYIVNPESSPGYSCGTPFGNGYDVWNVQGILLPTDLLAILLLFNMLGVAMHFCTFRWGHIMFLLASAAAILAVTIAVLQGIEIEFLNPVLYVLLPFVELLLIPAGIVCAIFFFVWKKTLIAGHIVLLTLSMMASCSMGIFWFYLYFD